jgi:hypothetical protein
MAPRVATGALGLIAGGGDLPRAVAQSAREAGRAVFVVALRGSLVENWVEAFPHQFVSLGEPGRALKALAEAGAGEILLAGRVDRPKFADLKLDAKGVLVLPRVIAAARQGDDALLRLVVDAGALGRLSPNADHLADIARGFAIVRALGVLDVGQAAAVCEGLALAVEAAEGTDAMIARIAGLRNNLRGTVTARRGVLVKALKPTQDSRTDMPVIGVETVRNAAGVGLAGIALEAGKSLIVDKRAVAAEADRLGIFVAGITP